ncbi:propanediol utilization protein [Defluviimonas sp. WL0024]|uniref:Propanediol utilization protein n=1 Tax=Albidovulum salinarum TaxID=2984153 RepID=A0ABT2X673_9RHOB|nr:propanediol utilization protein [Defluviimonas sp. WL0024]MCU9849413.1 propanediol utilization protein [Defluviimonas sp. WL0024]
MSAAAVRVAGHFGEFLQGRIGPGGPVALVTLPCPVLAVTARHVPGPGLAVHGAGQMLLGPARARRLLTALRCRLNGRVMLRATMPAGGGAGASTAALVALARLAGARSGPHDLARACVATEGASDPLMFDVPERLLWASRRAVVLDRLPPLPALDVVGGFYGPHRRTEARDMDFPDIADLIAPWRAAAEAGDGAAVAALAAESARRTLAMRGPEGDPTEALARATGAAGFAIAHTGSARALLFRRGDMPEDIAATLRRAGLRGNVRFEVGGKG